MIIRLSTKFHSLVSLRLKEKTFATKFGQCKQSLQTGEIYFPPDR